ncbi:MAG: fasciclin domain-containing protein [Actinomycetota bacterium]
MSRFRNWRIVALILALALVAAACGDDEDNSEPAVTEPATVVDLAVDAGDFTTLVAAVEAAGLVDTLTGEGPFTVFAPTDDAFAALPEGLVDALLEDTDTLAEILTYHVVAGEVLAADVVELSEATSVQGDTIAISASDDGVMVDAANVTTTDLLAGNGVVHVIDAVILPDGIVLPEHGGDMGDESMDESMDEEMAEVGTIVDVAAGAGDFTTLVAAVEAAGLVDTLSGEGPFTVFAPTDEAFAALPEGTVEGLLEDTEALTAILTYHVVAGEVLAADVVTLTEAETVNGAVLPIVVDGDTVMVGDATVVVTDIEASNGVIHVIDTVLIP